MQEYLKENDSRDEKGTKVNTKLKVFSSVFSYGNRGKIRRMKLSKMKIHLTFA